MNRPGPAALLGLALLLALGALLAWLGRAQPPRPVPVPGRTGLALDSAYLWQRGWTPQVLRAIDDSRGVLAELRVLALDIDAAGIATHVPVDLSALAASGLAIVPVVRIDGRRPPLAAIELAQQLEALRVAWHAAGVAVDEIELDHDSARAGLTAYADWIRLLRSQLPRDLRIAVTGLPDWLESPVLATLLARVDGFTLQVHAVDRPEAGLFDDARALRWARRFAAVHAGRRFSIALPTYAARIQGQLYWALPEDAETLLATLRAQPIPGLAGVRWFRLPLPDATDTWSPATLAAVIRGTPREGTLALQLRPVEGGALDVWLRNVSPYDLPLPRRVKVNGDCMGDGAGGFRLSADPGGAAGLVFLAQEADRLAPARERALGWLRCTARPELVPDASLAAKNASGVAPASD